MRTHRITQAAVAAVLLAGTVLVPPALAATPAGAPAASAEASTRAAAVPFTAATARRTADSGYTLSWSSAAGSVTVTAVTSPTPPPAPRWAPPPAPVR